MSKRQAGKQTDRQTEIPLIDLKRFGLSLKKWNFVRGAIGK